MLPILFKLGPVVVYSYGFFLALGYLAATFIFWREGKRQGYQEEKLIDFSVAALVAAIVGGRLAYIWSNWSVFSQNLARILAFWEGGFEYYGSFLLVLIVGFLLVRKWKWSFFQVADMAALSALAATVLAELGSFLSGNDFGKPTHLPWGVTFPFLLGKRHPTQIYTALVALVMLIVLYRFYKRNLTQIVTLRSGATFFYFLFFFSIARIIIEQFRGDSTYLFGIQTATFFSLILAGGSALALYYYQFRNFQADLKSFSKYMLGINLRLKHPFGR